MISHLEVMQSCVMVHDFTFGSDATFESWQDEVDA